MREELSPAMRQEGQIVRNDISVPVGRIPELIERGMPLVAGLVPEGRLLPFGHVGDGNLHFNIIVRRRTPDDLGALRERIQHAVCDLVQELGGSISAEHGIGRLKAGRARRPQEPARAGADAPAEARRSIPPDILNPGVILAADAC